MSINQPENSPDPAPSPDPAAGQPAGPEGLASGAFLARLRHLQQLHRAMGAVVPEPPMWGIVQLGCLILGALLGYGAGQSLQELAASVPDADPAQYDWLLPTLFLTGMFVGGLAPALFLKQIRKTRILRARQDLEDALRVTVRNFPEEIEHSGGIKVLADGVEIEALIHVLETKYPAAPATEQKL